MFLQKIRPIKIAFYIVFNKNLVGKRLTQLQRDMIFIKTALLGKDGHLNDKLDAVKANFGPSLSLHKIPYMETELGRGSGGTKLFLITSYLV